MLVELGIVVRQLFAEWGERTMRGGVIAQQTISQVSFEIRVPVTQPLRAIEAQTNEIVLAL